MQMRMPAAQLVKEPSFLLSKSEGFAVFGQKQRENKARIRTFPAPFCQLFQIHRSIFKPHPVRYPGQTSMMCITHRVFLFCVGKDTFYGFLAHRIDFFASLRSPKLLDEIQILLPNVRGYDLPAFFIGAAQRFERAILAVLRITSVGSLSVSVCRRMPQYAAMRTNEMVFFGIVIIFPRFVSAFFVMMSGIGQNGDSSIV